MTGKRGEGKSLLINNLLGNEVAKEGATAESEGCTSDVTMFGAKIKGLHLVVLESPCLQDDTKRLEKKKYNRNMKEIHDAKRQT